MNLPMLLTGAVAASALIGGSAFAAPTGAPAQSPAAAMAPTPNPTPHRHRAATHRTRTATNGKSAKLTPAKG